MTKALNVGSAPRTAASPANPNVAIYAGGIPTSPNVNWLFSAIGLGSYTTVVLWAATVDASGDISMNGDVIASGGVFNPAANAWATLVNNLRLNSSVTRIELSIAPVGNSFQHIWQLYNQQLFNPNQPLSENPLYSNLEAINAAMPLDAVNLDDEEMYDQASSVYLALICATLGLHVTICPYTNQAYWVSLVTAINQLPGTVDAVYLQCYDGGADNDPVQWSQQFEQTNLAITPGMWATHPVQGSVPTQCTTCTTSSGAQAQMCQWVSSAQSSNIQLAGGWMFGGTAMMDCPAGGTPASYSTSIVAGLNKITSSVLTE